MVAAIANLQDSNVTNRETVLVRMRYSLFIAFIMIISI